MSFGHWGKALRVNLSSGEIAQETLDETFLRRYIGGWGLIAHCLLTEVPAGTDPLGPENRLIYATGPVTGQSIAGGGRHMIGARSPLTGGFAGSESGGYFGAELKRAGWDMVIIEGQAPAPVYLAIQNDQVALRPAEHLWGQETWEVEQAIRNELGVRHMRVSQCGPAGERRSLLANVIHDCSRAAGRGGLGAVMGSKLLRAVAVRGTQRPTAADGEALSTLAKWFRENYMETGSAIFASLATMRMVRINNSKGGLPTRNFTEGIFDRFEDVSAERQLETYNVDRDTCYGCPLRCKWVVEMNEGEYRSERKYGGPEYETTGSFGPMCGVSDLRIINCANQICNANGVDTIGAGVTIAFAIECFERGLLGPADTDGLDLRFGNGPAVLTLLERLVRREGLGALLADGSKRAAEVIGGGATELAMHVKGQEMAMHDPRIKFGHGIGVAVSPTGADHMHNVHDNAYTTEGGIEDLKTFGVLDPLPYTDLSAAKVTMVRYGTLWRVVDNLTGMCMFHSWTPQQKVDIIRAVTGWNTSVLELFRAAERAYDMARAFNALQGLGPESDRLPTRLLSPVPAGPASETAPTQEQMDKAISMFYAQMGWDPATGAPTRTRLEELGVSWVADLLEERQSAG
jgi:aldehyde:ferredoxin oxidoreductase